MNDQQRQAFHKVLDRILDNLTDKEISDGIVDVIVQRGEVKEEPLRYEKVVVQALCCPSDEGVQIDELTKTICYDDDDNTKVNIPVV